MQNNQNEWLYRRIFGSDNDPGERLALAISMLALLYFFIRSIL